MASWHLDLGARDDDGARAGERGREAGTARRGDAADGVYHMHTICHCLRYTQCAEDGAGPGRGLQRAARPSIPRRVERNDSALVEAVAFGQRAKAFVRWQWQFGWFDEPTD